MGYRLYKSLDFLLNPLQCSIELYSCDIVLFIFVQYLEQNIVYTKISPIALNRLSYRGSTWPEGPLVSSSHFKAFVMRRASIRNHCNRGSLEHGQTAEFSNNKFQLDRESKMAAVTQISKTNKINFSSETNRCIQLKFCMKPCFKPVNLYAQLRRN